MPVGPQVSWGGPEVGKGVQRAVPFEPGNDNCRHTPLATRSTVLLVRPAFTSGDMIAAAGHIVSLRPDAAEKRRLLVRKIGRRREMIVDEFPAGRATSPDHSGRRAVLMRLSIG